MSIIDNREPMPCDDDDHHWPPEVRYSPADSPCDGCCFVCGWSWNEVREYNASRKRVEEQQLPTPNDKPAVWPLVIDCVKLRWPDEGDELITDMETRHQIGIKRYGTPLQPFNGRDHIIDAYQEGLDMTVYLANELTEKGIKLWAGHPDDADPGVALTYVTFHRMLDALMDLRALLRARQAAK